MSTIITKITDYQIASLLCCGFEGGVGYWCQIVDYKTPAEPRPVIDEGISEEPQIFKHTDYPVTGGAVLCKVTDEEDPEELVLDRAACDRGLKLMAEKYPRHWADVVADTTDADTGDVFIQLCLLGEVVYG